jgi:CheY-like chemotaxis protein
MHSIVRNEVRRLRRDAGPALSSLDEARETGGATPSLLRLDLERALARVTGAEADALRLYYLDDLSTREIARLVGSPEGTVRSWLHRGRRRLAIEMEEYAPMAASVIPTLTPVDPFRAAALIHRDLEPVLVDQITRALSRAGYQARIVTPGGPTFLPEALQGCAAIVLDEGKEGCSALETLVHLRAHPDTREVPVNVLCTDPPEFTVAAYFLAGVARLYRKGEPAEYDRMADQLRRDGYWQQFTERARRMVFAAKEEAARLDQSYVSSEHLLLGLLRDSESVACRVLNERLNLSLDAIRTAVQAQIERGPGAQEEAAWLSPSGKAAIDLAFEEARRLGVRYLGTEHLLIGLLRERYGLAARILASHGADLERIRQEVQATVG